MPAAKPRIEKSADAFRSIGEAAKELGLQPHVLRYWETKFPGHVRPVKRADGRRLFRPVDMDALRAIQALVHGRGVTLKGARALLEAQGVAAVLAAGGEIIISPEPAPAPSPARALQASVAEAFLSEGAGRPRRLETVLAEMTDLKRRLDAARLRAAA